MSVYCPQTCSSCKPCQCQVTTTNKQRLATPDISPCRTTLPTAPDVLAGRVTVVEGLGRTGWGLAVPTPASKTCQPVDPYCILDALHWQSYWFSLSVSLCQFSFPICQFVPASLLVTLANIFVCLFFSLASLFVTVCQFSFTIFLSAPVYRSFLSVCARLTSLFVPLCQFSFHIC